MHQKQPLITHLARSFRDAFRGLAFIWREERNFRIQIVIALLVLITMAKLGFTHVEIMLALFAILMVLAAEATNTAFEDTLDKIEPNQDPIVGKIKDVAAGIVVLNAIGAVVIGLILFFGHFW